MADNRTQAQAFWSEVFNAHDLQRVQEFIASESVNHNARPGTPDGPEGAREVFTRLWSAFPDMHFEIQGLVAEGDRVVCIGIMSGTQDGPFQGIPATHRHISARHVHVLTYNHTGLVTEHLAVRDDLALQRQLGVLPDDAPLQAANTPQEPAA
jgi:steroid delta-isomerase-like uncharacterized protein